MSQKMKCGKSNALWKECENGHANNGDNKLKAKAGFEKINVCTEA
jgi:hypothetical protein